jgi:GntP family gluconate:H+ symporter
MHPPFGFALFYLRSVAPQDDYTDRVTKKPLAKVTTGQIYWGAVPFVLIQVIMVGLVIAFPNLVSGGLGKKAAVDLEKVNIEAAPESEYKKDIDASKLFEQPASEPAKKP